MNWTTLNLRNSRNNRNHFTQYWLPTYQILQIRRATGRRWRLLDVIFNIKSETYFRNLLDQRSRLINVSNVAVSFINAKVVFTSFDRFTLTFRMINDRFVYKLASHIFRSKCLLTCRSEKILLEREILIKICFRVYMRGIFMLLRLNGLSVF